MKPRLYSVHWWNHGKSANSSAAARRSYHRQQQNVIRLLEAYKDIIIYMSWISDRYYNMTTSSVVFCMLLNGMLSLLIKLDNACWPDHMNKCPIQCLQAHHPSTIHTVHLSTCTMTSVSNLLNDNMSISHLSGVNYIWQSSNSFSDSCYWTYPVLCKHMHVSLPSH